MCKQAGSSVVEHEQGSVIDCSFDLGWVDIHLDLPSLYSCVCSDMYVGMFDMMMLIFIIIKNIKLSHISSHSLTSTPSIGEFS